MLPGYFQCDLVLPNHATSSAVQAIDCNVGQTAAEMEEEALAITMRREVEASSSCTLAPTRPHFRPPAQAVGLTEELLLLEVSLFCEQAVRGRGVASFTVIVHCKRPSYHSFIV